MSRKNYVIVMAAGHGTRMGGDIPKQFMLLDGMPILQRTMMKFLEACPDINVITVLPPDGDCVQRWKKHCIESNFQCTQIVVRGGITRFHSVRAALSKVPDGVLAAIHDGVRPLLSVNMIRSMFSRISGDADCKALIPVLPVVDTLKVLRAETADGGGSILRTVPGRHADRSELFAAQTPQIFRSECIRAAYGQAFDTSFTDDASVAEKYGIPLTFVEGERMNFKITAPDDLVLAQAVSQIARQA